MRQHYYLLTRFFTCALLLILGTFTKLNAEINYSDSVKAYLFNNNDKATLWAKKYLQHTESSNDFSEKAIASNLYGHTFYNKSVYDTALYYYFKSLEYCKQSNNQQYAPHVHNSIASAYYWQGIYEAALENYLQALKLFSQQKDTFWMVNVRYNIANIYFSEKKYTEAKAAYEKALEEYYFLKDSLSASYALLGIGKVAFEENDIPSALHYYKKALHHSQPDYDLYTYSLLHTKTGEAYLKISKKNEATYFLNKGLETARPTQDIRLIADAVYGLRKLYETTNDYKNYIALTLEYDSLSAIIFKEKQAEAVAEMKARFRLEELNEQLLHEQMAKQKAKQRNVILIVAILVALVVLVVIIFLQQKTLKQNKIILQQKKELEVLLKEKDVLLKEIHHRVKNNLQIVSSLLSLQNAFRQKDKSAESELQNAFMRINSMALLHKEIYNSNDISKASINDYITELADQILANFNGDIEVKAKLDIDKNISLEIEKAVPLGLILNELMTNSIKHKFLKEKTGTIQCSIHEVESTILMKYADEEYRDIAFDKSKNMQAGFGTKLIDIFCKKLKAEYQLKLSETGAHFFMQFKIQQHDEA